MDGTYTARELMQEQTLENLCAFSDRLAHGHGFIAKAGRCECKEPS